MSGNSVHKTDDKFTLVSHKRHKNVAFSKVTHISQITLLSPTRDTSGMRTEKVKTSGYFLGKKVFLQSFPVP